MSSTKIPLYVSNGKAYVWTVRDVTALRTQHRICGILTGTLPHLTQQNFFLGLPLLLMPEEVVLLLEKDVCTLVDDTYSIQEPTCAELVEWDENIKKEIHEQIEQWKEKEKEKADGSTKIISGDKEGRRSEEAIAKRRDRQKKHQSSAAPEHQSFNPTAPSVAGTFTITIPSMSDVLAWYQPRRYDTLIAARKAELWMYPSTSYERACCRVFRDLWEKGYYIGSGIKFGGEYLVYPGDPLRYHSHYVTTIVTSPYTPIRPMEIVAHGRLATGTKKSQLFCTWREESDTVIYYSVDWAGFG